MGAACSTHSRDHKSIFFFSESHTEDLQTGGENRSEPEIKRVGGCELAQDRDQ